MKNKHHEMIFTPFKDKLRNNITGSNWADARFFIFTTPKVSLPAYRCKKMPAQIKCPTQEWFSSLPIHWRCYGSSKGKHLLENINNYTTSDSMLLIKELWNSVFSTSLLRNKRNVLIICRIYWGFPASQQKLIQEMVKNPIQSRFKLLKS